MLSVNNVSFFYSGSNKGIFDISFNLSAGKILAVSGSNGSGKTTLLNLLSGNLCAKNGEISANGKIAVIPQFFNVSSFSVWDFVGLGLVSQFGKFQLRHTSEQKKRIEEILDLTGLSNLAKDPVNKISGGERQIAKIAQSLVKNPDILLLDEPISHLDLSNSQKVLSLIKEVCQKEGACAVIILHDIYSVRKFADFVLMLKNGKQFGFCGVNDFSDETVSELFSLTYGF